MYLLNGCCNLIMHSQKKNLYLDSLFGAQVLTVKTRPNKLMQKNAIVCCSKRH